MAWLSCPNWADLQHYKDRDPPWIKLHRKLLDNYEWCRLQDASKAHLMGIWLLLARHGNKVVADPVWIGQRISATSPVDLQVFVDAGFLLMEHDASTKLAPSKQKPTLEAEAEAEAEKSSVATATGTKTGGWPGQIGVILSIPPGRVGKALKWAADTHGPDLLVKAATVYRRRAADLPADKAAFTGLRDFTERVSYWVDQVRELTPEEQLSAAAAGAK